MRTSFASFWRRNLGFFRLGIISNLEYRLNYFVDAVAQPALTSMVEMALWGALFVGTGKAEIAGFNRNAYLSYALWAAFMARISTNWMYERRMIDEVDTGSINTILVRPVSFFEVYWSQFFGYKLVTTLISFLVPLAIVSLWDLPTLWSRLPLTLVLLFFYLLFSYLLSLSITAVAFHYNRAQSLTTTKNFILWMLSGEFFPLDLIPEPWRAVILKLPFGCGVYLPTSYLVGRVELAQMLDGFVHIGWGIVFMALVTRFLWQLGVRQYTGTGA